jgi:hypothetical protein
MPRVSAGATRRLAGLSVPVVAILVAYAWYVHARSVESAEHERERVSRYFTNTTLPPAPPIHARVGETWTFRVASLHDTGPAKGSETWEVLEVTPSTVKLRIAAGGGGTPSVETWSFRPPVQPERVVRADREVVRIADRTFVCDMAEVVAPGGEDWLRAWIVVDLATELPTFPGVVRLERTESRGRRVVEWDLVDIAPTSSH